MWLHESESNSLIRQACKNKIFLTIIYISYNSQIMNFQTIKSFILVLVLVNILVIVHKEWLIREIYNWSGERRRAGQLHYE